MSLGLVVPESNSVIYSSPKMECFIESFELLSSVLLERIKADQEDGKCDSIIDIIGCDSKFFLFEEIDLIEKKVLSWEVSFSRDIELRQKVAENAESCIRRMEAIMNALKQELEKIDPIAARKFETMQTDVMQRGFARLNKKIANLYFESLASFYSTTLDSLPQLHEKFSGSTPENELFYMHSDIQCFLEEEGDHLSLEHIKTLDDCSAQLKLCSYVEGLRREPTEKSELFYETLNEDVISKLAIGESILLPGGSRRHAILYEITRIDEKTYTFMIINTGDDERGWFKRKPLLTRISEAVFGSPVRYAHKGYRVTAEVFTPEFFKKIAPPKTKDIPAPELVAFFDQVFVQEGGGVVEWGRLHHPQKRGSCAVKCISSWVKGKCIERHGEQEGNALYFKFKAHRTAKNLEAIRNLEKKTNKEALKDVYSDLVYAKSEVYDHYAVPKVTKKIFPDDSILGCRLMETYSAADSVLARREQRAKAYTDS